ncbi:multidrug transporter [Photobacterium aquae]|uniref:Multidrug transporter n=1 Tax=Photobacterium aquae TaxID=1195763 RepID=A0A0J1JN92_9GAMM|nr:HlyD family secretion protein [Photobacterium aquae]KLV03702.1 multidrug transporter [Photobacterium aquae]
MKKKITALVLLTAISMAGIGYIRSHNTISTDNAYIKADITAISPEVGGQVSAVYVTDNQRVNQGDALFAIDDTDYQANLSIAKSALAVAQAALTNNDSRLSLQLVNIAQAQSQIDSANANYDLQHTELARYKQLIAKSMISKTQYDTQHTKMIEAKARLDSAKLTLKAQQKNYDTLLSERDQLQAQYQQAQSKLNLSEIALERTVIKAPVSGYIANRQVQKGKFVQPGMGLITMVPDTIWVDANFKETQLKDIEPGQTVDIVLDMYPDTVLTGSVESITPATGAQFSLLPPQNATGNFVKVVQRVPVKINLTIPDSLKGKIYPGLSATVTVASQA